MCGSSERREREYDKTCNVQSSFQRTASTGRIYVEYTAKRAVIIYILLVIQRDESASQVNPEDSTDCETETEQQVHSE